MDNWEIKRFEDIITDNTIGLVRNVSQQSPDYSFPYLKMNNITPDGRLDIEKLNRVEASIEELDKYSVKKGDFLFNTRNSKELVGKTCVYNLDEEMLFNNNLMRVRFKERVSSEFIQYQFYSPQFKRKLNSVISGTTNVAAIYYKSLRGVTLLIPDYDEQKRIVSKLDALFERIDQSIALLEENLKHTQALMSSVLDEFYKEGDTPLSAVVELNPKKSQVRGLDEELEVTFLPMAELNEFQISFEKKQAKPLKEVYKGYTYFQDDDVLLAKVTPCFENQKGGLATGLTNGIGFGSSEYHVLRPSEKVIPEWIYYAIMSREFNNEGKRSMTGAVGLKRVPSSFVENWKIPIPSIEDQKKSIRRIQAIFDKSKESIIQFDQKLNNLKALKSSLLDKAFKGEL